MKKYAIYGIVILLAAGSLYMVFAATDSNTPMMGRRGMGRGMMMKPDMMGKCPICMSMMQKQMVATEDGGVVVMAFGELIKFDKDLNVVKQAEIPFDPEKMEAKMQKMMQNCPFCKMMQKQQSGTEE